MPWAFKENRPIFQQICDMIVIRILNGTYPMGSKLPSVREMAEEAGVNPNTMQRAMSHLEEKGLAITNRTSGRTVTTDEELLKRTKREYAVAAAEDFLQEMKKLENIVIYNPDNEYGPLTFNDREVFSQDAAGYLASKDIAVRSGNHCAKILHGIIGTDSTIRASLYFYNTKEEVDRCVKACSEISLENAVGIFF